jgi:hypothetical protein
MASIDKPQSRADGVFYYEAELRERHAMTALFANSHSMQLSEALASIGELKNVIADMMHRINFTDVVHTQGEVAGNRSGVRVSVIYLHIADRAFWQVAMAAGDTENGTRAALNDVLNGIKNLHFL